MESNRSNCLNYFARLLRCKPLEVCQYIDVACALNPSQNNFMNNAVKMSKSGNIFFII